LVARWGVWRGVLLASLLFAAVHFHPVHALAVVPLGIALHLVYLATRSLWGPVLLHFLNNAWATSVTKLSETSPIDAAALDVPAHPALLIAAAAVVVTLMALLWRTRPEYLLADGTAWNPGYVTAEAPPESLPAVRTYGLCTGRNLITAAGAWAAFGLSFISQFAVYAQ
jgi:hypothetical protein